MDAIAVEAKIQNDGTPDFDRRLQRSGKRPSSAAASGISAQIIVQPFSAPRPEMITSAAITLPQNVPPNIVFTAVEKGAFASASFPVGSIPTTAVSESM